MYAERPLSAAQESKKEDSFIVESEKLGYRMKNILACLCPEEKCSSVYIRSMVNMIWKENSLVFTKWEPIWPDEYLESIWIPRFDPSFYHQPRETN